MTEVIYDSQAWHGSIPEIVALSRVAVRGERTNGNAVYYSRQAYDTYSNQAETLRRLPEAVECRRKMLTQTESDRILVERLGRLVDHAFLTVPFYRRLYERCGYEVGALRTHSDFEKLPTVTRAQLLGANKDDRTSRAYQANVLHVSRTSGSSGLPLDVAYTDEQYVQSMCNYIRQFEMALGHLLDPRRWIYNIHHARWWLSSLCGQYRTFAVNDLPPIDPLLQHLEFLRPQVMAMLPSHAKALAQAGVNLRQFGVEAVTTNSEQSFPQERAQLSEQLGVPVRDEYSSVELEQVAFECQSGKHHVFQDSAYMEVVDCDVTGVGSIVGTNLNAWAMPMIRYLQGDLARASIQTCQCGSAGPAFGELLGRVNASFITLERRLVPSASLLGITDDFLARRDSGVQAYRLVQRSCECLELHYVGQGDVGLEELRAQLERLFGHALSLCAVRHDHELPHLGSYKRQLLVSDLV